MKNAQLYPQAPDFVIQHLEKNEPLMVRIDARTGHHYWFTDRRILWQIGNSVCPLFRYDCVDHVYWMCKNPTDRFQMTKMKKENYDRLVVDVGQSEIAIDGLDQAYIPTLSFLQWLIPVQPSDKLP